MSITLFKQKLVRDCQSIRWSVPYSAQGIPYVTDVEGFAAVYSQQIAEDVPMDQFPFVRISIPDPDTRQYADMGGVGGLHIQTAQAHLFIYMAGYAVDWQGIQDYFDGIIDATVLYFARNAAPTDGQGPMGASLPYDHLAAKGLRTRVRREPVDRTGEGLALRATIAVDLIGFIA